MLGSNPVKLEPGLRLAIPFVHTIHHVNMRETSVRATPNILTLYD